MNNKLFNEYYSHISQNNTKIIIKFTTKLQTTNKLVTTINSKINSSDVYNIPRHNDLVVF